MSSQNANINIDQNVSDVQEPHQINIESNNLPEGSGEYEVIRHLIDHFHQYSALTKDPAFDLAIKVLSKIDSMIKVSSENGKIRGQGTVYSARDMAKTIDQISKDQNFANLEKMYFQDEIEVSKENLNPVITPEEEEGVEEILEEPLAGGNFDKDRSRSPDIEYVGFLDAETCRTLNRDFYGKNNNYGFPEEIQIINGYDESPVSRWNAPDDNELAIGRKFKEVDEKIQRRLMNLQKRRKIQENREMEHSDERLDTSTFLNSEISQNYELESYEYYESRPSSSGQNLGGTGCGSDMEIESDEENEREEGEL